jgi:signal peptidase II
MREVRRRARMSRPLSKFRLLAVVFVLGIAADQTTKFLAVDRLTQAFPRAGAHTLPQRVAAFWRLKHLERFATEPYVVYRPLWRMNYVENPHAAFGLGSFLPPGPRHVAFVIFAFLAVGAVLWFYIRLGERQRLQQVTLALVLAGAVGNVVDRLVRRYVIDFIEWYWWNRPDLRWPTFNVADSMLTVGIVLLLLLPQEGRREARGE